MDQTSENPRPHFVVTRLGLGIYDEKRLDKMIGLFEAVTLPSVTSQTSQDFHWLIVVDAACPAACKARILDLISGHQNYHYVPIDLRSIYRVRLGCFDWVWDACESFIFAHELVARPDQYAITSILDADDAWNRETVEIVGRTAAEKWPEVSARGGNRGTWLRHSVGLTITFLDGYVWFVSTQGIWPLKEEFRSMSVFVVARLSSGISACSCRHTQWRKYSEILDFEVISLPTKVPMWIYSRHDEAVESWNAAQGMQMPASFRERLESLFGIAWKKLDEWLQLYPPAARTTKQFNFSAAQQYDLMFQIAALNREIRALEDSMIGGSSADLTARISEKQSERERLIATLSAPNAG